MQTRDATARDQALDFTLEVMSNPEYSLEDRLSAAQMILRCTRSASSEPSPQADTPSLMRILEQFLQGPGREFIDELQAVTHKMTKPSDTRRV